MVKKLVLYQIMLYKLDRLYKLWEDHNLQFLAGKGDRFTAEQIRETYGEGVYRGLLSRQEELKNPGDLVRFRVMVDREKYHERHPYS